MPRESVRAKQKLIAEFQLCFESGRLELPRITTEQTPQDVELEREERLPTAIRLLDAR